MKTRILLLALASLHLPHAFHLVAQEAIGPVPLDSRVRVTMQAPAGLEYVGRIRLWGGDSLYLAEPPASPVAISILDVRHLEISLGTHGHAGTGALIGGGIGAALGLVVVIATATDDDPGELLEPTTGEAALGAVVLTAAGAGLGALIGLLIRHEDWQLVPKPYGSAAAGAAPGH